MKLSNYVVGIALVALGYCLAQLDLGLSAPIQSVQAEAPTPSEKPAYIVVTGRDYDREALVPYVQGLASLYKKYDASYVGVSTDYVVLEGEHNYQSIVVTKWPSLQTAEEFWWSPEYAELKKLREGKGIFDAIAFEIFAEEQGVAPLAERK